MILELTKPFNPGDADPGKLYTHLHLEFVGYNSAGFAANISYAYGTLDDAELFVLGKASTTQSIIVQGDDLATLQQAMPKPGEPLFPGCFRVGYETVQQKLGIEGQLHYDLPANENAASTDEAEGDEQG